MRMQITFKSGAQIVVDAEELSTERRGNELTKMTWTMPDDWTARLQTITLSEVVAVVTLRAISAEVSE